MWVHVLGVGGKRERLTDGLGVLDIQGVAGKYQANGRKRDDCGSAPTHVSPVVSLSDRGLGSLLEFLLFFGLAFPFLSFVTFWSERGCGWGEEYLEGGGHDRGKR